MNIFPFLLTLIVFVFFIGLFVIAHELGHFFFARRAGILCHEFAVGMGPVIYKKKKGETTFTIRLLPIGGFVQMASDLSPDEFIKQGRKIGVNLDQGSVSHIIVNDNMDSDKTGVVVDFDLSGTNEEQLFITLEFEGKQTRYPVLHNAHYIFSETSQIQIAPYDRTFDSKTVGQRALTLVFGPIMNFIAAIVIYLIFWSALGVPNQSSNVIGSVVDNNPAVGVLEAGDRITAIGTNSNEMIKVNAWRGSNYSVGGILEYLAPQGIERLRFEFTRDGIDDYRYIDNNIIINSAGLSNLQVSAAPIPYNKEGIRMGNVVHNFVNNPGNDERRMANGDILYAIYIHELIPGTNNFETQGRREEISSWSQLVEIFYTLDVARIKYVFYSYVDGEYEQFTSSCIETFGTELLENQRVRNIIISVGITPEVYRNIFSIITSSFRSFINDFTLIFRTLSLMIAPSGFRQVGIQDLSGPVGIFQIIGSQMEAGVLPLLTFVALLSVNFGVLNLLPIPALDGGRLVFLGYEAVTKKKVNKKVEILLTNIIFMLLMMLMLFVTFNDVLRIFG